MNNTDSKYEKTYFDIGPLHEVNLVENGKQQTAYEAYVGVSWYDVQREQYYDKPMNMRFKKHEISPDGSSILEPAIKRKLENLTDYFWNRDLPVSDIVFEKSNASLEEFTKTDLLVRRDFQLDPVPAKDFKKYEGTINLDKRDLPLRYQRQVLENVQIGKESKFYSKSATPDLVVVHAEVPFTYKDSRGFVRETTYNANFRDGQIDIRDPEKPKVITGAFEDHVKYVVGKMNDKRQQALSVDYTKFGINHAINSRLNIFLRQENKQYYMDRVEKKEYVDLPQRETNREKLVDLVKLEREKQVSKEKNKEQSQGMEL